MRADRIAPLNDGNPSSLLQIMRQSPHPTEEFVDERMIITWYDSDGERVPLEMDLGRELHKSMTGNSTDERLSALFYFWHIIFHLLYVVYDPLFTRSLEVFRGKMRALRNPLLRPETSSLIHQMRNRCP